MYLLISDHLPAHGGGRSALLSLIEALSLNKFPVTLAIQKKHLDKGIKKIFSEKNIKVYEYLNRPKIFYNPFLSIFFDLFLFIQLKRRFRKHAFIISSIIPRSFFIYFQLHREVTYIMHTVPSTSRFQSFLDLLVRYKKGKNKLITVSGSAKKDISQTLKISEENIHVIYNPLNNLFMNKSKKTKPYTKVLTVGHFEKWKNVDGWYEVAVKVIKEHSNVIFEWVGNGSLKSIYQDKINKAGLKKSIIISSPTESILKYYEQATLYFHPSRKESQGLATIEAMSQEIPIVATYVGLLNDFDLNGIVGFIHDVQDLKGMKNSIKNIISNKERSDQMGRNARLFVLENFLFGKYKEDIRIFFEGNN